MAFPLSSSTSLASDTIASVYANSSEGISEADIHRYHIALVTTSFDLSESMTAGTGVMQALKQKKWSGTLNNDKVEDEDEDRSSTSTLNHSFSTPRITDFKPIPTPKSKSGSKSKSKDQLLVTKGCSPSTSDLASKKVRKKEKRKEKGRLSVLHTTTAKGTLAEELGGGNSFLGHGNGKASLQKEAGGGRRDSSFFVIDDPDSGPNTDTDTDSDENTTTLLGVNGGRTNIPKDSHIATQSMMKRKTGEKKSKSAPVHLSTTNSKTKTVDDNMESNMGSDTEVDTDEMDEIEIDELLPSSPVRFSPSSPRTP